MGLYINAAYNDESSPSLVRISVPNVLDGNKTVVIKGFLQNPFTFGQGQNYSELGQLLDQQNLSDLIKNVSSVAGLPQVKLESVAQTIKTWSGPSPKSFSFNFRIINYQKDNCHTEVVKDLLRAASVKWEGRSDVLALTAPLGYNPSSLNITKDVLFKGKITDTTLSTNTISVSIGSWLNLSNLLIDDVETIWSTQYCYIGTKIVPLYVDVSLSVSPCP